MGVINIVIILMFVVALSICAYEGFRDKDYKGSIIDILIIMLIVVFAVFMISNGGII